MNEFLLRFNGFDQEMVEIYRVVPGKSFVSGSGEVIKRRARKDLFGVVHCDMFEGDIMTELATSEGDFVKIRMEVAK